MDDVATKPASSLYDEDFYAWTQVQAGLLRRGQLGRADIVNILEEIETLGRKEVAELRSRLKVLAHHLLKEIHQPEKASRSWAVAIVNQRDEIVSHLQDNPSLKAKAPAFLKTAYASARKNAAAETSLAIERFPQQPPFSYEQAMDESFWPGRTIQDRE